jgi:serine/threonine protein phosphatase PrpC
MLDLEFFELTDVGRVRDHNEDYLGSAIPASENEGRTQGWLFVLADGVGGAERGEVASQTAVESVIAGFRALFKKPISRFMNWGARPARAGPPWLPRWWPALCGTTGR